MGVLEWIGKATMSEEGKKNAEQRKQDEIYERANQANRTGGPVWVDGQQQTVERSAQIKAGAQSSRAAAKSVEKNGQDPNYEGYAYHVGENIEKKLQENGGEISGDEIEQAKKEAKQQAAEDLAKVEMDLKLKGKRAPAVKNPDLGDAPSIEESILREYGNNFFELWTYDSSCKSDKNKNGMVKIAGILKQLPTFTLNSTWEAGPAAALTDIVKSFMCSDLMEMLNAYSGWDRSWVNVDEGTDRVYASVSQTSFNLEFRVYTNQTIGSRAFSSWDTIKNVLALFAQPSIASKVSINAMGNNVVNSVAQGLDKTMDLLSNARDTVSNNVKDSESTIDALGQSVVDVMNSAAEMVFSRDDYRRVEGPANDKSFYGGKLWKLRLMPGIFQRPLIVYVPSWSMNISKEINFTTNEPIYVDFTITCQLDQIPNSHTWTYYFDKNVGTNVFNKDFFNPPKPKPAEPVADEDAIRRRANESDREHYSRVNASDKTATTRPNTYAEQYELDPLNPDLYGQAAESQEEKRWDDMTQAEREQDVLSGLKPGD